LSLLIVAMFNASALVGQPIQVRYLLAAAVGLVCLSAGSIALARTRPIALALLVPLVAVAAQLPDNLDDAREHLRRGNRLHDETKALYTLAEDARGLRSSCPELVVAPRSSQAQRFRAAAVVAAALDADPRSIRIVRSSDEAQLDSARWRLRRGTPRCP
jgi:hypothetical protein